MATAKQIAANRRNAQRSTGPRTAAGKKIASRDALRHGLSLPPEMDAAALAAINELVTEIAGDYESNQNSNIAEVATAVLEVMLVQQVRNEMVTNIDLSSATPNALQRLAAIDRYENRARTRRRRAASKLEKRWPLFCRTNLISRSGCSFKRLRNHRSLYQSSSKPKRAHAFGSKVWQDLIFPARYVEFCTMMSFHLIDWPVRQVEDSKPQQHAPNKFEPKPPLNKLLRILEPVLHAELRHETDVDRRRANLQIESTTPSPISDVVVEPTPDITSMPMEPTSSISTDQNDPKPYLRKAVVAPDIYTLPVHRFRAIDLRWVLRDIKGDRLKLSPVDEEDLRDLIDMGLIEMRDDRPVLTSAGVDVIS
jgi:hypothetical protein